MLDYAINLSLGSNDTSWNFEKLEWWLFMYYMKNDE